MEEKRTYCGYKSLPEMASDRIDALSMTVSKSEYDKDEDVHVRVRFSVRGASRDAFNEANWTDSYNANDVSFKIKYGIRLHTGGLRKKTLGKPIDTYKKAAIFWTRNPRLVNAVKEKRIWVQVAKNFTPVIRLTEADVRGELFDFDETYVIKKGDLGVGVHKVTGDVHVSWQKHHFLAQSNIKESIPTTRITIN